jgi:hypothetical protein
VSARPLTHILDCSGADVVRSAPASLTRLATRPVFVVALAFAMMSAAPAQAEDGYDLWLRYLRVDNPALLKSYQSSITSLIVPGQSPTARMASTELQRGLTGLLGAAVSTASDVTADGAVIAATAASPLVAGAGLDADLRAAGDEGYVIRSVRVRNRRATIAAAVCAPRPWSCSSAWRSESSSSSSARATAAS